MKLLFTFSEDSQFSDLSPAMLEMIEYHVTGFLSLLTYSLNQINVKPADKSGYWVSVCVSKENIYWTFKMGASLMFRKRALISNIEI